MEYITNAINTPDMAHLNNIELDEISDLQTVHAALAYIKDMPESKKRLVMKQFYKEMAVRQWQTIAAEKYKNISCVRTR